MLEDTHRRDDSTNAPAGARPAAHGGSHDEGNVAGHVAGLDLLRFLAAALVVAFHYGYWNWADPQHAARTWAQPAFPELAGVAHVGWVGVQIFFVISGFVIASSAERSNPYAFVVSRATRLVPAMWICATLSLLVVLAFADQPWQASLAAYLRSVAFFPFGEWIDPAHWTLPIEIVFYGFVFLLLLAGKAHRLRAFALALGVVSSAFVAFEYLHSRERLAYGLLGDLGSFVAGNRWVDLVLLRHGCEFALGMLLWRRFRGRADGLDVAGMVLFLGASLVQILRTGEVLAWSTRSNDGDPYAAPLLFLIALAGLLFALRLHRTGRDRAWSGTTVRTLGLMTYPLYLVHQAAGGYLMSFLHHHGVPRFAALAIVLAGVLVLSAVVATALEPRLRRPLRALLERVPWRRAPAFAGVRPARGGG